MDVNPVFSLRVSDGKPGARDDLPLYSIVTDSAAA